MREEDSDSDSGSDSEDSDSGSHVLIIKFVRTLHICSILWNEPWFSGALYLAVHYISNLHANLNRPLNQVYYEIGHDSVKCSM